MKRKTCPNCNASKAISKFGVRFKHLPVNAPGQVVQSWCIECRRTGERVNPKDTRVVVKKMIKRVTEKLRPIEVAEPTPIDRETLTAEYRAAYPNDKGNNRPGAKWGRPIKFMLNKLAKKNK